MLKKVFGSGLIWVALAFVLVAVLLVFSIRVGQISGTEVGVLLNKWSGEMTPVLQSGTQIYFGISHDLYVFDKTLRTLEMTGNDALKVKTIDGSDVYVDLKVQYAIQGDDVVEFINTTGPQNTDHKMEQWARDFTRSIGRDYLGELSTEEFYNSMRRNEQIEACEKECREILANYGIDIDDISVPTKPRFYKEYEQLIKQKKLAVQAVEEERSKAKAALQRRENLRAEETNKKNVAVEEFEGQMEQRVIKAEAEATRTKELADAYFDKRTIGAEAKMYELNKQAEAVLARKKAEAEGIEALKKALEGEGGRNMVKLEYARKLQGVTISGQPFTRSGMTERFEHLRGANRPGTEAAGSAAATDAD
jgi:regulator of protease activity HflC (stomatin/prohibitin superfamily)